MKVAPIQILAAWVFLGPAFAAPAQSAEPTFLFGVIGKAPVMLKLRFDGDRVDGWYLYFAYAGQLLVTGSRGADGAFELKETASGKTTGQITGVVKGGQWTGFWSQPEGTSPTPFSAHAIEGAPADFSGTTCFERKVGLTASRRSS